MRITIARLGEPADAHGNAIAPGAISSTAPAVPVFVEFDYSESIGQAVIHPDGSADLELAPGIELDVERAEADGTIGIGYRALDATEADGIRTITRLEILMVGVSRLLVKRGGGRA